MRVEGMSQPQPVEPVKLDTKRAAAEIGGNAAKTLKKEEKEEKNPQQDPRVVEKAVSLLNKTMESYNTELRFTLHKESGEYMVKVISTKDNSVIREIPPKRVLDMVAHFKEVLGIIVDKFI